MSVFSRLLTVSLLLLDVPIVDFFYKQLEPEKNIGLWFGAFVGAWILQIIRPYKNARYALAGFLVGLSAGIYWGGAWFESTGAGGGWRGFTVALIGELFIRGLLLAMTYFSTNPGEAVDATAGRADNITKIVKAFKDVFKS